MNKLEWICPRCNQLIQMWGEASMSMSKHFHLLEHELADKKFVASDEQFAGQLTKFDEWFLRSLKVSW